MSPEPVTVDFADPVARVFFDRPEVLNAGDRGFVLALGRVFRQVAERGSRVVVLGGRGRAFSTGVDLRALANGELGLEDLVAWEDVMTSMGEMSAVLIAGINGHCLGGGLQLALVL